MESDHFFTKIQWKNENQQMHVKTIFSYSHKDAVYQFLASNSQFQLLRFSKNFFMMAVTLTGVRVLAFEPRKGNNKGAENGKLFAILSGAGNNYIVCSKSCGVPPSHVMTTGTHPIATPGELSSILYWINRKILELALRMPRRTLIGSPSIPLQRDSLVKCRYKIDSKI